MKNKLFWLGMLGIVLVLGMLMSSCAAYMRWVYSVDPDFGSRGTVTVFPGGDGSQGGGNFTQAEINAARNAAQRHYQDFLRRHNWPAPGTNAFGDNRGSGYTNHGGGFIYTFHLSRGSEIVHSEVVDFTPRR